MKRLLHYIFLIDIFLALAEFCLGERRIVSGKPVKPHALPWMAEVVRELTQDEIDFYLEHDQHPEHQHPKRNHVIEGKYMSTCGGFIVSPNQIISAAHCFYRGPRKIEPSTMIVMAGVHDVSNTTEQGEENYQVESYKLHSKFTGNVMDGNDMAILKINGTFNFSNPAIDTIDLAGTTADLQPGKKCKIAGWGYDGSNFAKTLMEAEVPVLPMTVCQRGWWHQGNLNGEDRICAGGTREDTCSGDSGTPLACYAENQTKPIAFGLTSFGDKPCGSELRPAIYTNIPYFRSWFDNNLHGEKWTPGTMVGYVGSTLPPLEDYTAATYPEYPFTSQIPPMSGSGASISNKTGSGGTGNTLDMDQTINQDSNINILINDKSGNPGYNHSSSPSKKSGPDSHILIDINVNGVPVDQVNATVANENSHDHSTLRGGTGNSVFYRRVAIVYCLIITLIQ